MIKLNRSSSKALNRMKRGIVKESKRKPQRQPRRPGRPIGGRTTFAKMVIDALPDIGRASDVARALGVERASVQQWWEQKDNPLPFFVNHTGRRFFRRDEVVAWLAATGRYKARTRAA